MGSNPLVIDSPGPLEKQTHYAAVGPHLPTDMFQLKFQCTVAFVDSLCLLAIPSHGEWK